MREGDEEGAVMAPKTQDDPAHGGSVPSAVSNAIRQLIAEYTGRGPTRARTSIRDNLVVVMLEDTLTKGERRLVSKGRDDRVLDFRREFQEAMREDAIASVELITGRRVAAFMSANHIDPDLAVELFVLEPIAETTAGDGAG
jgi:uncharacterized protein YbcI